MHQKVLSWLKDHVSQPKFRRGIRASQAGMTLIEIIIVIALLGTLMAIIVNNLTSSQDEALIDQTRIQMQVVKQQLQLYRVHMKAYPSTEQGLNALIDNPNGSKNWRGPYIEAEKLDDPWGNPFEYEAIGRKFKITSGGPNGSIGDEDDISDPEESASGES